MLSRSGKAWLPLVAFVAAAALALAGAFCFFAARHPRETAPVAVRNEIKPIPQIPVETPPAVVPQAREASSDSAAGLASIRNELRAIEEQLGKVDAGIQEAIRKSLEIRDDVKVYTPEQAALRDEIGKGRAEFDRLLDEHPAVKSRGGRIAELKQAALTASRQQSLISYAIRSGRDARVDALEKELNAAIARCQETTESFLKEAGKATVGELDAAQVEALAARLEPAQKIMRDLAKMTKSARVANDEDKAKAKEFEGLTAQIRAQEAQQKEIEKDIQRVKIELRKSDPKIAAAWQRVCDLTGRLQNSLQERPDVKGSLGAYEQFCEEHANLENKAAGLRRQLEALENEKRG